MSANYTPEAPSFKTICYMNMQRLTNFPFIEADFDALTNYELLCKIVEYLNEVISNNNEQNEVVTALYNAYTELQDYVNDYFDNLDVQEEINNKLDNMAQDGSLTNLIKAYVDPIYTAYETEINATISDFESELNDQNDAIALIDQKVNSVASGSPLVASSTSEMTETDRVYVNTTDGKWYYYDGDSWEIGGTYQSTGIGDNAVDIENLNTNLQNSVNCEEITLTLTDGYYISTAGTISEYATYSYSDAITLNAGDIITFTAQASSGVATLSTYKRFRQQNQFIEVLRGQGASPYDFQYTAEKSGLYYICGVTSTIGNVKVYRKNINSTYQLTIKHDFIDNVIDVDLDSLTPNKYLVYTSGTLVNFTDYDDEFWVSDFTEVLPDKNIILLSNTKQLSEGETSPYYGICFYDENRLYISGYKYGTFNKLVMKSPANAKYCRLTVLSQMKLAGFYLYYSDIMDFIQNDNTKYKELYKCFLRVGVIGDSLASGESAYKDGQTNRLVDIYKHSWGQYMARNSGNTYYNFSAGGMTAKAWLSHATYGYPVASQNDNLCDAYIIGLGVNDANTQGAGYIGSSSDIDLSDPDNNEDSFYGNYAKIIQKMQILQPKAKFFVITMPRTATVYTQYNDAIIDIASILSNVYVIDLAENRMSDFASGSFIYNNARDGHYNAIAYSAIADIISDEINKIMNNNYTQFNQIEFIGTNYSW